MDMFGKKVADLRKERKMTQEELAKMLNTSISVVGRYERGEMIPSIEVAKKIAQFLNTTVGYLLGENDQTELFKDPTMLERFEEVSKLPKEDKVCIYSLLDAYLAKNKLQAILK